MSSAAQNPEKHANWLRQSLAHDKRPLGILIGAGCPAALSVAGKPLIPTLDGLTKVVAEQASKDSLGTAFRSLADHFTADHGRAPNVEDLLTFCRSLLPVAGKGLVRDLSADQLVGLDKLICALVVAAVDKELPDPPNAYHQVAAWVGAIQRSHPIELFTTNYDLLVEKALEQARVPYFDGFVGAHRSFFDTHSIDGDGLPARWARLWKVHGSISWKRSGTGSVFRGGDNSKNEGCVIHPSHLKYDESRRMPYIALMDRFRAFLRQPNALIVACGFSFQDQHINGLLLEALQGNPTATVFVLFRRKLDNYKTATELAMRRPNLTILAADGGIVGTKPVSWAHAPAVDVPVSPGIAVEWTPVPAAGAAIVGAAPTYVPRFLLGNFETFGTFLADLIGPDEQHGQPVY